MASKRHEVGEETDGEYTVTMKEKGSKLARRQSGKPNILEAFLAEAIVGHW
jgi:Mn-dependent DtxR family transcriptional regulator